jgi:PDZ domain/PilZ domain
MSFSPSIEKDNARASNRRACPREALSVVVLVYFGQHNWGKLLNISESGMAFEFDQLPPLGQPISFTLETIGRPSAQPDRELPRNCIQAHGQVVWTKEFERAAGVQFVDLATGTQEQVRQWLSVEASPTALVERDKVQHETISSTTQKDDLCTSNRRACSREALSVVVLVYFGQHNWGKLLNISESGMAFEFDQLPPLGQPINFILEAMGRPPAQPGKELFRDCIQAHGQVVWTKEFERAAGVQFLDLAPDTQEQVKQWLSVEALPTTLMEGDKVHHSSEEADSFGPLPNSPETTSQVPDDWHLWDPELREDDAEVLSEELEPGPQLNQEPLLETLPVVLAEGSKVQYGAEGADFLGPPPIPPETTSQMTDGPQPWDSELPESDLQKLPRLESYEQQKRKGAPRLNARIVRIAFVGVSGCLGLLAVAAGVRMIRSRWSSMPAVTESIGKPSTDKAAPSGTGLRSATESTRIFQVEVVDANKRRPLLTFDDRTVASATDKVANAPESTVTSAKPRSPYEFKLAVPKAIRAATNASTDDSALAGASALPTALFAAPGKPLGGIPAEVKAPSVAPVTPADGQVQLSHPLSSVSPTHSPPGAPFNSENMASALGVLGSSDGVDGVKIIELMPNSPAATAGLAVGDIISAIDGNVVKTEQSLAAELANRKTGSKVRVTFKHNAWLMNTTITIRSGPTLNDSFGLLFPEN